MGEIFRQGAAVGGHYAVTGTLPLLADVAAFMEGAAGFEHGYYRFVSHPRLRIIESALKECLRCRHCRLAESPEIALLELLLCLRVPGSRGRIVVLREQDAPSPIADETFLPPCDREGVTVLVQDRSLPTPPDLGRGDIVIVCAGKGTGVPDPLVGRARQAADAGASVIAWHALLPGLPRDGLPEIPGARFHVVGFRAGDGGGAAVSAAPLGGGAVLGSVDRVMDRLALQVRRRGPILSSRVADALTGGTGASGRAAGADERVAATLNAWEGGSRAFLYASGMSAITRVLDVLRLPGKSQVIAVGHLFNDTFNSLRLAPRAPGEAANIFRGVDELDDLRDVVSGQTALILTETITNPLSDVPDLELLSRLARERGIPLVVDNTLATPENCRPFEFGADVVIHSTTKYMNGRNDHGGGAVIVRDDGLAGLLAERRALWKDGMSPLEAEALEANLATMSGRMRLFNANASRVASFLAGHPGVARIWFNGHPSHRSHATARRILKGPGSVISFTLADESREALRTFYDSPLAGILKAPSLGSDATLLCPYTLLTHHGESDEALAAIGLPRHLLRIAVGCEESIEGVMRSLDDALRRAQGVKAR